MIDWDKFYSHRTRARLALDFEYQDNSEKDLSVICCALYDSFDDVSAFYWTSPRCLERDQLIFDLENRADYIFLSWNVTAEARAMLSLGLDPMRFDWIDLMVEWKMYRNGKKHLNFPKVGGIDSLLNATKVFLGKDVDLEEKNRMRDFIIRADRYNPWDDLEWWPGIDAIKSYCSGDIKDLVEFEKKFDEKLSDHRSLENKLASGKYMASLAVLESRGIDIDVPFLMKKTESFARDKRAWQDKFKPKLGDMLQAKSKKDMANPEKLLVFKRSLLAKEVTRLAKRHPWDLGTMSEGRREKFNRGKLSYEQACGWSSELPMLKFAKDVYKVKSEIITQDLIDYLEQENEFKFFSPPTKVKGKMGKWWHEAVGSDGRIRPYFNPFGSSTGRNYPPAKSFPPANHEIVANSIVVPRGKCLVEMDYGQQEFLINGVLSGDENMIADYLSGDPYVALAKRARTWDGTKEIRDLFKETVLGLGFGLQTKNFWWNLRLKLQKDIPFEQAEFLFNVYWSNYSTYQRYREILEGVFKKEKILKLPDGVLLHYDKAAKKNSFLNHPTQGSGGSVLRASGVRLVKSGLDVRYPFHDAYYFICDYDRVYEDVDLCSREMQGGWHDIFPDAPDIKLEATVYSAEPVLCEWFSVPTEWKFKGEQVLAEPS